jgi:hypothetical protein
VASKLTNAQCCLILIETTAYQGESRARRVAQYKRVLRALDHLGIAGADRNSILYVLDFTNTDGKPYPAFAATGAK